jgi:hypothetical protein
VDEFAILGDCCQKSAVNKSAVKKVLSTKVLSTKVLSARWVCEWLLAAEVGVWAKYDAPAHLIGVVCINRHKRARGEYNLAHDDLKPCGAALRFSHKHQHFGSIVVIARWA